MYTFPKKKKKKKKNRDEIKKYAEELKKIIFLFVSFMKNILLGIFQK
jgi:hypothetical protein